MEVRIENIAGIIEGGATITPGINTVQASNWQGKSSFVRAVETAFGTKTTLTDGRDEGCVAVDLDGDTYRVCLDRHGRTVERSGTPVLDDDYDRLLVDLFAFLGEDNEVRAAVRSGEDLKPVLTRPLDLADIDAQIAERKREREAVRDDLQAARDAADRLVALRRRREEIEDELADLREREAAFEDAAASERRDELSELRAERDRVRDLVERLENSVERSQSKLAEVHEEYESIEVTDTTGIEAELADVRESYERAREDRELLQSVYSANKRLLDEDRLDLLSEVRHGIAEDTHACWLCGGETTAEEMRERLDAVGDEVLRLREAVEERESRIEELETERDEAKRDRRRKEDLERRISELESTNAERNENLASARERLSILEERIADLETEVDGIDTEISEVRGEIKYREAELEDLTEQVAEAEAAADRIDDLEAQAASIESEIEDLRTRKEELQTRIRTAFDESIETIVPRFQTSFESARLTSEFDLVVARDGREVGLDALSEGEVELLGLVTAVAGFEAYDVGEVTPVIVVDQLGGLADDNLLTLADYLDGLTESLVLTTYPENSLRGQHRIDPGEWEVVRPVEPPSA